MFHRVLAAYLLGVLLLCISMGALLYLDPGMITGVWPYTVKSLATRMFASMFLAIGVTVVSSFVVGLPASARGALVTITPIFGMVLAAALLNLGAVLQAGARSGVWLALFGVVAGAGAVLLYLARSEPEAGEGVGATPAPRGLRWALAVHTVVVIFFGLNMLIVPAMALNFWPWKVSGIVMQGLGGFFVGSAVGTGWSAFQKSYERIRAVLPSYFTFTGLVLLAVVIDSTVIAKESPGVQVTVIWLSIYFYVTIYSASYFLRLGGLRKGGTRQTGKG